MVLRSVLRQVVFKKRRSGLAMADMKNRAAVDPRHRLGPLSVVVIKRTWAIAGMRTTRRSIS